MLWAWSFSSLKPERFLGDGKCHIQPSKGGNDHKDDLLVLIGIEVLELIWCVWNYRPISATGHPNNPTLCLRALSKHKFEVSGKSEALQFPQRGQGPSWKILTVLMVPERQNCSSCPAQKVQAKAVGCLQVQIKEFGLVTQHGSSQVKYSAF